MSIIGKLSRFTPAFFLPFIEKIEMSPMVRRLTGGAFWSLGGALISRGLNLVAAILVARFLGKAGYGELGIIQSTAAMFQVVATFGVGVTATKFVAEFRKTDRDRAGNIIALSSLFSLTTGVIVSTAFFLAAPWLADRILNRPELSHSLAISSAMLFFAAWMGAQTGALAGFEAFKKIAFVNLFSGLISFPLILGGAFLGNLIGAVLGMTIAMGVNTLLNSIALFKERRKWSILFKIKGLKNELNTLWKFSLPSMFASLLWAPVVWFGNSILVNQNGGYAEMGLFNAAHHWFLILLFIPNIIGNLVLPIMAERIGVRDFSTVRSIIIKGVKYTFLILFSFSIVLSILSQNIMALYGVDFTNGWPILILMSFSATFAGAQNMMTNAMVAINRVWFHFSVNLIWGIFYIIFASLFINKGLGAIGLAGAGLLSYSIRFFFSIAILLNIYRNNKKYWVFD